MYQDLSQHHKQQTDEISELNARFQKPNSAVEVQQWESLCMSCMSSAGYLETDKFDLFPGCHTNLGFYNNQDPLGRDLGFGNVTFEDVQTHTTDRDNLGPDGTGSWHPVA